MKTLRNDKVLLLVIAYLFAVLLAIPLTIVSLKNPKENRTAASGNATLYFSPSNLSKNTGESFSVDIMVNPGTHAVSYLSLDILYDPAKLTVDIVSFTPNASAFPSLLEGPIFNSGRIRAELSVGFDPTNAITTITKAATVSFKAEAPTDGEEAMVHFGESSYILSVSPSDNATDNVLGTVTPLQLTLTGDPTGNGGPPITQIPTFGGPTPTPLPTMTPSPTPVDENTPTPEPSSTQTPTPTPNAFCEESERRSGWPECIFGSATYNKQTCRSRAENWKGVDGPTTEDDSAWYTWAINPPKPLSCGTTCGIAPTACDESPTTTPAPSNTDSPTATQASAESYATSQVNPTDMMLVALLLLPIILLAGHLLV